LTRKGDCQSLLGAAAVAWEKDDKLDDGVADFSGNIGTKVSRADERLPVGSGSVQAEVLIVQLHRNLTWRACEMRHRESGQSWPDQCFEGGGANLH
jgi:hypothetical protein